MAKDQHDRASASSLVRVLEQIEEHLAALRTNRPAWHNEWLTVEEAARQMKLSRDTIERLIGSGQLKAAAIDTPRGKGRRRRFRIQREWVDEFMRARVGSSVPIVHSLSRRRRRARTDHDFIG
ncbi:MAG TPA: excisionase family DNA-binding protein [Phycisphaerae bacterium]|nr:excisionase family DNA-binding protein [Phycisphaerae bacterium]